ncbi:rod shape-determining protein MreC [Dethiosulfatibacter aminovorans DSM 17477]|uniref:Cell shape-determining protein MreC n=1 Tax=Dethiosulfatibacter aminovorans DSM 17477 TaxID=1121476 RepID=A0A1M6KI93_9FIRM|nr:rod shape-determining protein MreC [Dethiosulfatibacter aminovorans]SHJ58645.1 rod shape-determining protein MreC [Dethiosulfatibacter aminovorans DSM 17477]
MHNNKRIIRIIFVLIILFLIASIGLSSSQGNMSSPAGIAGAVFSPVQKVFYSIGQTFSNSFESILNISKIREENLQLKEKMYSLQEENLELKYLVNNSAALTNAYEMLRTVEYDFVRSQIISRDIVNWFGRFTLDKGSSDDINVDDIVIQAMKTDDGIIRVGLIGKITDVGPNWSKVVAINDVNSSVSIKILRTNETGVISGTIEGETEGYMFKQTEDLNIGDQVMTSGLGEIYIPNLYIGEISKIEKTSDLLTEKITVDTSVDFEKLFEVYIIRVER